MEQLVATANNLFDFAIAQYERCQEVQGDHYDDYSAEDHFDCLLTSIDKFIDAVENSDYLEDMEDQLAAMVGSILAISVVSGLFTEPIDPNQSKATPDATGFSGSLIEAIVDNKQIVDGIIVD